MGVVDIRIFYAIAQFGDFRNIYKHLVLLNKRALTGKCENGNIKFTPAVFQYEVHGTDSH